MGVNLQKGEIMKRFTLSILVLAISITLVGCASSQPSQKSNLTYGSIKKNIVAGKTTQEEVVKLLGSPNIVTKNKKNNEVWTYTRQSYDSKSGSFGGGIILLGGNRAFSSNSTSSFDLIMTFDGQDIVEDYSVVASQF